MLEVKVGGGLVIAGLKARKRAVCTDYREEVRKQHRNRKAGGVTSLCRDVRAERKD